MKARTFYADGEKALESGDVETAQKDFEQAYQTLPNAAVLLRIGECRSRRADYRAAVEAFERYLSERPSAPDRAAIESKIAAMKTRPGFLTVKTMPAGAAIWVDGAETALVTPSEVELTPGEHALAVKLPPYESVEQSVVVEFASKQELELTLAAPSGEATGRAVPSPASTVPSEPGHGTGYHATPAFWIAAGGAVAGAGVTVAFGVIALDKHSDFDKHPTRALYDEGRQATLVSDIALGVAGACAVTAGVLFFTSKGRARPSSAFMVAPTFGRGGGGISGSIRF